MTDKPPTWEQYTSMQFKLERESAGYKQDRDKWKFHATDLVDQRGTIDNLRKERSKLSNRIRDLELTIKKLEKQVGKV